MKLKIAAALGALVIASTAMASQMVTFVNPNKGATSVFSISPHFPDFERDDNYFFTTTSPEVLSVEIFGNASFVVETGFVAGINSNFGQYIPQVFANATETINVLPAVTLAAGKYDIYVHGYQPGFRGDASYSLSAQLTDPAIFAPVVPVLPASPAAPVPVDPATVPEPSSIAMLAVGVGMIGFTRRRRKVL